jgi:hypothetical protein
MIFPSEVPPRVYASKIIASKSKDEAQAIADDIPKHLKPLVQRHVENYYAVRSGCKNRN